MMSEFLDDFLLDVCSVFFSGGTVKLLLLTLRVVQEGTTLNFNEIKRCVSPHC